MAALFSVNSRRAGGDLTLEDTAMLALLNMPGNTEWIVVLIIALLLFGKRLPEVMRSLGRGIVEFKKGIQGVEEDINASVLKSGEDSAADLLETDEAKKQEEKAG